MHTENTLYSTFTQASFYLRHSAINWMVCFSIECHCKYLLLFMFYRQHNLSPFMSFSQKQNNKIYKIRIEAQLLPTLLKGLSVQITKYLKHIIQTITTKIVVHTLSRRYICSKICCTQCFTDNNILFYDSEK